MLSNVQYKLIALMKNHFKETITKLFYGTGTVDLVVIDTKSDKSETIKVPTIRQLIIDNIGPADLITGTYLAGENIKKYAAVYFDPTSMKVYNADYRYANKANVLGFALNDALINEQITITNSGRIENQDWNWNVNGAIYLKIAGTYDQSFPESGTYIVRLGTAISPTVIDINISSPILNNVG